MRLGSLFTGAGGLDAGVRQSGVFGADIETVWVSDIDERKSNGTLCGRAEKFLNAKHPDITNLGDITRIEWERVEPVDIIVGGSPCQDLSTAGGRAGMKDGTRSGLWYSMCSGIDTLKPRYVLWENVRGALTAPTDERGVSAVQRVVADLEYLGYGVRWLTLTASSVGAAHKRERVFLLGELNSTSRGQMSCASNENVNTAKLLPTPTVHDSRDFRIRVEPHRPNDVGSTLSRALTHYEDFECAVEHWGKVSGNAVPTYYELMDNGTRLNVRFSEWLMGWPEGYITDVDIPRYAQFALIGNGVVPQQASWALKNLLEGA